LFYHKSKSKSSSITYWTRGLEDFYYILIFYYFLSFLTDLSFYLDLSFTFVAFYFYVSFNLVVFLLLTFSSPSPSRKSN